jgi:hypothetical protein
MAKLGGQRSMHWHFCGEIGKKPTQLLNVISHFNPDTKYVIDTCGQLLPNEKGRYYPMLKRVFWCSPQCVTSFTHFKPIISVDATFLTRKYKGTLMVVVDMIAENQLLPLAFALVEGENNESWPCSLGLIRKKVLGPGTSICMISDRHHGLFNGAKQHLEGYPPLIHMWCSRHFTVNIWKKQRSKKIIIRLKALCKIKDEKKFEARLKELKKILNDDAKS